MPMPAVQVSVPVQLLVQVPAEAAADPDVLCQAVYDLLDGAAESDDCIALGTIPGARISPDWMLNRESLVITGLKNNAVSF